MMDPRSLAALVEAIEEAVGGIGPHRGDSSSTGSPDVLSLVGLVAFFTYCLQRENPEADLFLLKKEAPVSDRYAPPPLDEEPEWSPPMRPQFRTPAGSRAPQGEAPARVGRLSPRATPEEREIVALLAEGLDPRAIAARMSVGYATVLLRLQGLLEKLDVQAGTPVDEERWREPPAPFESRVAHENPARSPIEPLTAREREVLSFMAAGLDNRTIADRLVVSYATVRSHVQNILEKLSAHSRIEAVARAHELGLLRG